MQVDDIFLSQVGPHVLKALVFQLLENVESTSLSTFLVSKCVNLRARPPAAEAIRAHERAAYQDVVSKILTKHCVSEKWGFGLDRIKNILWSEPYIKLSALEARR